MYTDIKRPDYTDVTGGGVVSCPDGVKVEGGGESGAFRRGDHTGGFEEDGVKLDSATPVTCGSHREVENDKAKDDKLSRGNIGTDMHRQDALMAPELALKGPEPALKGPGMALEGTEPALKEPGMALKGPEPAHKGPELMLNSPAPALKGPEKALTGSRLALKGPEMATDDGTITFPEREQSPRHSEEISLTRLYEGTFFGEMALIYDEPRNANIRAATKVDLTDMLSTAAKTAWRAIVLSLIWGPFTIPAVGVPYRARDEVLALKGWGLDSCR